MDKIKFLVQNYQTPPEAINLVENTKILLLAGISGAGKDTTKKQLLKKTGGNLNEISNGTFI